MALQGPSEIHGQQMRRIKTLTLDAQVLVRLLVAMQDPVRAYRVEGLPEDARVVGTRVRSPWEQRDHEVQLIVESQSFPDQDVSRLAEELDLRVTAYTLPFGHALKPPIGARAVRLRTEEPIEDDHA